MQPTRTRNQNEENVFSKRFGSGKKYAFRRAVRARARKDDVLRHKDIALTYFSRSPRKTQDWTTDVDACFSPVPFSFDDRRTYLRHIHNICVYNARINGIHFLHAASVPRGREFARKKFSERITYDTTAAKTFSETRTTTVREIFFRVNIVLHCTVNLELYGVVRSPGDNGVSNAVNIFGCVGENKTGHDDV